jgi:hypothetical protein
MIRRVAEEPEPSRLLEEALGAPFAVFDLVARKARVTRAGSELVGGSRATVFELHPGDGKGSDPGLEGLRKWRNKASIDSLSGRVVVDDASGALLRCDLTAKFATAEEPKPVTGTVEVHTLLTDIAAVAPIEKPPAEDLAMRQRTLPEQRELLRGLGQVRPAAEPARPAGRPKAAAAAVKPGPIKAPASPGAGAGK